MPPREYSKGDLVSMIFLYSVVVGRMAGRTELHHLSSHLGSEHSHGHGRHTSHHPDQTRPDQTRPLENLENTFSLLPDDEKLDFGLSSKFSH